MRLSEEREWYYPRAVVAPDGRVFVLGHDGKMFYLDPAGNGTITQLTQQTLSGDRQNSDAHVRSRQNSFGAQLSRRSSSST